MYWYMNEEKEQILDVTREFVQNEVKPVALELDKNDEFPLALFKRCGELGLLAPHWPEEYGGLGLDWTTFGLITEEITKESPVLGVAIGAHTCLAGGLLMTMGSEEQKKKYLPKAASGEIVMAMGNTEACGALNFFEFSTRAVPDGDDWVINGGKIFITNIGVADVYIVNAITSEPDAETMKGISCFIIEKDTPGFEVGKMEHKLGWRGSNTGSLYFKNVRVPKENLLGPLDYALQPILFSITDEFMSCGPLCLGQSVGVYEKALEYTKQRLQNGVSLYDQYQVTRHKLAKMYTEIEVLRGFVYMALAMRDADEIPLLHGRMCKIKGYQVAMYVADEAIQVCGGNGLIVDNNIERYFRDARVMGIGGAAVEALIDDIILLQDLVG